MRFQPKMLMRGTGIIISLAVALMVSGCSSHEPKPMTQPSPEQVRGHADRGFDKLKQEEQNRAVQPEPR
jgi:hypothetical protein